MTYSVPGGDFSMPSSCNALANSAVVVESFACRALLSRLHRPDPMISKFTLKARKLDGLFALLGIRRGPD